MMYFANNSGLLEFDGEGWRVYNDSTPWAFRSVLRARGRIYVGTFGRIGYYAKSPVTRRLAWHPISLPDSVADFGDFWGIVELGGRIVFQSQSGLLLTDGDSVRRVVPADSHFLSAFSAASMCATRTAACSASTPTAPPAPSTRSAASAASSSPP